MTNWNINAYGVQEMNKQEMIQTEGGFIRIVSKITIDQYMNFMNNKPIGRLIYVLL